MAKYRFCLISISLTLFRSPRGIGVWETGRVPRLLMITCRSFVKTRKKEVEGCFSAKRYDKSGQGLNWHSMYYQSFFFACFQVSKLEVSVEDRCNQVIKCHFVQFVARSVRMIAFVFMLVSFYLSACYSVKAETSFQNI